MVVKDPLTSLLSLSICTRNVGSSFWKRFNAREKLGVSAPTGLSANEMTGSGTYMEVYKYISTRTRPDMCILTMEKFVEPSVKVSPDAQSIPKMAQISPGPIS